jgi:hypothetical protein
MLQTWDSFEAVDVLLVWLSLPFLAIFMIIGTTYWFCVRPVKLYMVKRKNPLTLLNEMDECGLNKDNISAEVISADFEDTPG